MQLVVLRAVMTDAMMLPMIWRMVFHVSLFFMVSDVFLGFVTWREPLMYDVRWLKAEFCLYIRLLTSYIDQPPSVDLLTKAVLSR